MPFLLLIYCLTLLWRMTRRLGRERERQRVVTWPRVDVELDKEEDGYPLKIYPQPSEGAFKLSEKYRFYSAGTRYASDRIVPASKGFRFEQDVGLLPLLKTFRKYRGYLNVAEPERSYLAPGRECFGWYQVVKYAFWLVGYPAMMYTFFTYSPGWPENLTITLAVILAAAHLLIPWMVILTKIGNKPFDFKDLDPVHSSSTRHDPRAKTLDLNYEPSLRTNS